MILTKQKTPIALGLLAALAGLPVAGADLPVTGVPVPELAAFDDAMQNFMAAYDLSAGVLAVMKDGCVVYQRGFGWLIRGGPSPPSYPLPENTPMRIASVEKPLTAATVRRLAALGSFSLQDHVFDLGQPGGGILQIQPWPSLGDARLADITVEHLLLHRGGWDKDAVGFDPQYEAISIAQQMGIPSPPGRVNTARYMLGQPLQYTPGTPPCDQTGNPPGCYDGEQYSNFGFMLLGLIVEHVTGVPLVESVRQYVLTPEMWVPATEVFAGRTFQADQSPREPVYMSSRWVPNVFDPGGPFVNSPYGGWHHEASVGHGNLVAGAAPLLIYLRDYVVIGELIGTPLNGGTIDAAHTGLLDGTSTVARQRVDGINIVVLFTRREKSGDPHYAWAMSEEISTIINNGGLTWPTRCIDGSWVDFNAFWPGFGGYNDPFPSMNAALSATAPGAKLLLKPGTSNWTGTISMRVRLDAPLGMATIGK